MGNVFIFDHLLGLLRFESTRHLDTKDQYSIIALIIASIIAFSYYKYLFPIPIPRTFEKPIVLIQT